MILQMELAQTAFIIPSAARPRENLQDLRQCLALTCGQAGGREKGKGSAASLAGLEASEEPRVPLELHALRDNYRRDALPDCQCLPRKKRPAGRGRQRGQFEGATKKEPATLAGAGESVKRQCCRARSRERAEGRQSQGETLPDLMAELHQTSQCSGRTGGTCRRFVMSS